MTFVTAVKTLSGRIKKYDEKNLVRVRTGMPVPLVRSSTCHDELISDDLLFSISSEKDELTTVYFKIRDAFCRHFLGKLSLILAIFSCPNNILENTHSSSIVTNN